MYIHTHINIYIYFVIGVRWCKLSSFISIEKYTEKEILTRALFTIRNKVHMKIILMSMEDGNTFSYRPRHISAIEVLALD